MVFEDMPRGQIEMRKCRNCIHIAPDSKSGVMRGHWVTGICVSKKAAKLIRSRVRKYTQEACKCYEEGINTRSRW